MRYDKIFGQLPEGWTVTTLDQCAEVIDPHPSHRAPTEVKDGYPFLGIGDLDYYGNATFDQARHVSLDVIEDHEKNYEISNTSIGYAKMGNTIGKVVSFPARQGKYRFAISPALSVINPNKLVNPYYLRTVIESDAFWAQVNGSITGSTRPSIGIQRLRKILIPVATDVEQKIIGEIWKALYDKIKLNQKINDNLQEQVRALCNSWLNDYVPFGGTCPDNWVLTPLSSFVHFTSGYSYKGGELQESSVAMATIKNFHRKGGFKLDGYKEIIPSSKLKPEQHAELFDTLVAHTDLTQNAEVIGNAEPVLSFFGYDDIIFSMDVVKVVPDNQTISKFLIAAMLQTQQFKSHCLSYVNGTTVLHLSKKALPEYSLMLPQDFSVLKPLDEAVSSMYQQIALNIDECVQLTNLRDTLLPKLMSGEIDVSAIQL